MKHPLFLTSVSLCASVSLAAAKTPPPLALVAIYTTAIWQPTYGFGTSQIYAGDTIANFSERDAVYKALFQDLKIDIAIDQTAKSFGVPVRLQR